MSEFEKLVEEATKRGEKGPLVHGLMGKVVDGNGKVLHSTLAGHSSVEPNASPLDENVTLKLASATKFITSVALLQCIEQGRIGLDEDLSKIVPEFNTHRPSKIIESVDENGVAKTRPRITPITARHLLSHTSGFGYRFLQPLLIKWSQTDPTFKVSNFVTERYDTPLLFEPGQGWTYGSSLDWAGAVVRRLHDTTLEEYLNEYVWKRVGRTAPFPTFCVSRFPEYKARLMQICERTPEGGLVETEKLPVGDNPDDEEGGGGLVGTMGDYLAVMQDLVSDTPKLLKPETIELMYEPQLEKDSPAIPMLMGLKGAWEMVAGPVKDEDVNHGLGGLLLQGPAPEIGQPTNILCWGGASNIVWFMAKDQGIAGFLGTQILPFADPKVKDLVNAWKKDFWDGFNPK